MKLIFAQGNPGLQYAHTRHNIGWLCLDDVARSYSAEFIDKSKFYASIAECTINSEKVLLVKPTTFYNETGRSARALMGFYKVSPQDILVIHDDLALAFGKIRVRHSGSDAGNNGIKSLNAHIGNSYTRLKVGIWTERRERVPDADYVLSKFSAEETAAIQSHVLPKTSWLIEQFVTSNLSDESYTVLVPE